MNHKIYTFASWKGGTGKTSLACAAIETLSKQGATILIIDLDSNLSMSSIYNAIGAKYTSIDLLNGNININPKYYRPTEVDLLIGDYLKARETLGWKPTTTFNELARKMITNDIENVSKIYKG